MLGQSTIEKRLDALAGRLRQASMADERLFEEIAAACPRIEVLNRAGKTRHLRQLIAACAWTDAALALIKLELPHWKLRRVVLDDGQWQCCLSIHAELPTEFDDVAEASHEVLSLAMLSAMVEARRDIATKRGSTSLRVVPNVAGNDSAVAISCDNYA
jgi:hypothetical protein